LSRDQARNAPSYSAVHRRISGASACCAVGGVALPAGLRTGSGGSASVAAASAALMIVWI